MFCFSNVKNLLQTSSRKVNFYMCIYFIYINKILISRYYYMSSVSNAVMNGVALGLYNTSNILFGALTSYSMYRSGLDPFNTLFVNLDSPSGFSSWADPSYATPLNVELNASGYDTTFAPLTSAITGSFLNNPLFGGGIFGYGYSPQTYVNSSFHTHLGCRPGFNAWF